MLIAYVGVTAITILANAGAAVADLARADPVLRNSAEVGVSPSWLPLPGALKAAGAAGLLLGLLGVPGIGVAAAAGLVAFFIGAVAAHLRAGVLHNLAFPGTFLALAIASLTLATWHSPNERSAGLTRKPWDACMSS